MPISNPASYVDLKQTFSRRGFPSLPFLRRCVKYLMNVQSPKEIGRELEISSQLDAIFFDLHSCIPVQSSSVNRQARFIFIGPDRRATISESYITYLHFDDKVSTALARSRHKNSFSPNAVSEKWRGFPPVLRDVHKKSHQNEIARHFTWRHPYLPTPAPAPPPPCCRHRDKPRAHLHALWRPREELGAARQPLRVAVFRIFPSNEGEQPILNASLIHFLENVLFEREWMRKRPVTVQSLDRSDPCSTGWSKLQNPSDESWFVIAVRTMISQVGRAVGSFWPAAFIGVTVILSAAPGQSYPQSGEVPTTDSSAKRIWHRKTRCGLPVRVLIVLGKTIRESFSFSRVIVFRLLKEVTDFQLKPATKHFLVQSTFYANSKWWIRTTTTRKHRFNSNLTCTFHSHLIHGYFALSSGIMDQEQNDHSSLTPHTCCD